jgi:hypothetical protein
MLAHSTTLPNAQLTLAMHLQVAMANVHATTQLVHDGSGASLQVRWRRSSIAVLARLLRRTACQVQTKNRLDV